MSDDLDRTAWAIYAHFLQTAAILIAILLLAGPLVGAVAGVVISAVAGPYVGIPFGIVAGFLVSASAGSAMLALRGRTIAGRAG